MSDVPANLEPALVWKYFLDLSGHPRPSKHEKEAADWIADRARALGLEVERDAVHNVLIRKPATPGREGRPGVALQAHVDMVGVKDPDSPHDFLTDPIRPWLDGDLLKARGGTTLGADNGIGVACAMAVLESRDLEHGPVEVLVTVDEETEMTGARNLGHGWLKARYLLNLDSEEEGFVTIGCAGGASSVATRAVAFAPAPAGKRAVRVRVFGGLGGHSGIDIEKGRANAIRILAQVLDALRPEFPFDLARVHGGTVANAIPAEAEALVLVDPALEAGLKAAVKVHAAHWKAAYGAFDPGIDAETLDGVPAPVMAAADADALLRLLLAGPHGVEAMSPDVPGLVQTSTNLGLVRTEDGTVRVNFLSRSSIDASRTALAARIAAACAAAGFDVTLAGAYPGWKPEPGAPLVALVKEVHQAVFGEPLKVIAIHAGLECGMIGPKHPGLQMASIGPNMWDVHTPKERVSVSSVARFWQFLKAVLAAA